MKALARKNPRRSVAAQYAIPVTAIAAISGLGMYALKRSTKDALVTAGLGAVLGLLVVSASRS